MENLNPFDFTRVRIPDKDTPPTGIGKGHQNFYGFLVKTGLEFNRFRLARLS